MTPPLRGGGGPKQALVGDVQSDHRDIRTGVEHAVRGFGILNDIGFGNAVPTVAGLREAAAHHHKPEFGGDIRRASDRSIDIGERAGGQYGEFASEPANLLDQECDAVRCRSGDGLVCYGGAAVPVRVSRGLAGIGTG